MGIFDIFGTGDQTAAANAQIAGINAGTGLATGNINTAINGNNSSYAAALQPYLQNYSQAQAGVTQLGNVLGLNGASGNASAMAALQNTPGYQFQLQQGDNAVNAAAAANGTLNSGNQNIALSNYNQGLASTTYNNYVSQLQPYLNASNSAAGGIAGVNTGQAAANASQYDSLAGLNYGSQTGIGNANANADLAGLTASGNIMNLIGSLGGAALGGIGGGAGGALGTGINSALFGASPVAGASGPTSVGGAPLSGGTIGGNLFGSIFSDERLKEDIAKVGELFDGTNVYSYRYKGSHVPQIGLMAQEVEQTHPDAVTEVGGYKAVDYGKATRYAAELSGFLDDAPRSANVVEFAPRQVEASKGFAADLARFLEAA
jgi:endosialidase-like protein